MIGRQTGDVRTLPDRHVGRQTGTVRVIVMVKKTEKCTDSLTNRKTDKPTQADWCGAHRQIGRQTGAVKITAHSVASLQFLSHQCHMSQCLSMSTVTCPCTVTQT